MATRFVWIIALIGALALSACEQEQAPVTEQKQALEPGQELVASATEPKTQENLRQAEAELKPTEGSEAQGKAIFTEKAEGVEIHVEVQGLPPGKHGIHIHEEGDCSAPDASSAGGHYNPQGTPHGAPDNPPDQRHVGDLGNIEIGEDGTGTYKRVDSVISLRGMESVINRALIIHEGPDDLSSQPTGDAGGRLTCGVIKETERDN